ncbi:MAG: thymidine kinase [Sphingosinicella sp.]
MAKLYFYYSAMNAGKSTTLLQADFNYRERGMATMLWTADFADRGGHGMIDSRIGLTGEAHTYKADTDIRAEIEAELLRRPVHCVLIDEAQFLTRDQVLALCDLCDEVDVPVLCYGLRSDFTGRLFEGSGALLALADALVELKTICECGRKATMNLRVDEDGTAVHAGEQIGIGGNEAYVAMCRRHFFERLREAETRQLRLELKTVHTVE